MLELFSIEGFPMQTGFLDHITETLQGIEADGLLKREREIVSPQSGRIQVRDARGTREMINLCANNYLGLSSHPAVIEAAHEAFELFAQMLEKVGISNATERLRQYPHQLSGGLRQRVIIAMALMICEFRDMESRWKLALAR